MTGSVKSGNFRQVSGNCLAQRSEDSPMKPFVVLLLSLACSTPASHAEVVAGRYDMAMVRDASALETRVLYGG